MQQWHRITIEFPLRVVQEGLPGYETGRVGVLKFTFHTGRRVTTKVGAAYAFSQSHRRTLTAAAKRANISVARPRRVESNFPYIPLGYLRGEDMQNLPITVNRQRLRA